MIKTVSVENEKLLEYTQADSESNHNHYHYHNTNTNLMYDSRHSNPNSINSINPTKGIDFSRYKMMEQHIFNEPTGGIKPKPNTSNINTNNTTNNTNTNANTVMDIDANMNTATASNSNTHVDVMNRKIGPKSIYHIPFKHYNHVINDTKQNLIFLLIYNIDGCRLQYKDIQSCLGLLGACPYIRIIATFDHLNTARLDNTNSTLYKWNWIHIPTFIPTKIEIDQFSLYKMNKRKRKKNNNINNINNNTTNINTTIDNNENMISIQAKTKHLDAIWTGTEGIYIKFT